MFQPPEPTAFLQVPPAGYGIAHGLPQYTFEETPLGLGGGGGGYTTGAAGAAGSGGSGAGTLIYTTPIFSSSPVGPTPGAFHQFHHSSSPSTSTPSPASSVLSHHHHQHHHLHEHHQRSSRNSSSSAAMESSHDVHAQEAAAREYQPNLQGPLVGEKIPSTVITEEYAKADPIYVQKTMQLPRTYSHYRPIQGDGNCGWRAIIFGYFETLISLGSKAKLDAERQRLESLNSFIETAGGHHEYVYQPMADMTIELFERLSGLIGNREAALNQLLDTFNNPDIATSIIYHFRLLAGAWFKGNSESFAAFITSDLGVSGYSDATIERPNVEIDNLGIVLLVNVLLKPADFVLEVAYLDRSAGSEVNTYRFPDEANGRHPSELGPVIHLLFRPDHYDILYPTDSGISQPPPPPPTTLELQVHRAANFSHGYEITSTPLHSGYVDSLQANLIALLPGSEPTAPGLGSVLGLTTSSPISPYTASPASSWMSTPFAEPIQQQPPPPPPPPPPSAQPTIAVPPPASTAALQRDPVRFSEYCQLREYTENSTWKEPSFTTATFKNSHFNIAHYNNPNFQPEEYKPEADDFDPPAALRSGARKRGSV